MKVIHFKDVMPVKMESDQVRQVTGRVLIGKEDGARNFCARMFELGEKGHTPRHTHDWEHEIFVFSGAGKVYMKDRWNDLKAGSAAFIPGGVEHQFKNDSREPFRFICVIPSGPPEL